jgi:hypothetical protein
MLNSRVIAFWRAASLAGGAVLLAGLGSMYADYAFKGGIDVIDEHFNVVLWASMVGMLLCAVSLVGWPTQNYVVARSVKQLACLRGVSCKEFFSN